MSTYIKFDEARQRWVVYAGGQPMASSTQLGVLERKFPGVRVVEA